MQGRKASTLAAYETTLRAHLAPYFGDRPIHQITTEDVEGFIASRTAKGCAPKSIRNYVGALHAICDYARVRPNPVTDARKPEAAGTDPDIRFLSEAEVEALLRGVPDDPLGPTDRALYLTAAMTGLRQGELFALRWRDVDWVAGRIRVRRSYARKRAGREAQFGKPKSKRSSRSVPMHDRVGQELERHYQRSRYQADDALVFCHPNTGGPLDHSNVLGRLRDALADWRRAADHVPRPAPHVRDADGRGRRADAHPAGVDGAPRHQDDDDLRRLHAERARARVGRGGVQASDNEVPGRRASDRRSCI